MGSHIVPLPLHRSSSPVFEQTPSELQVSIVQGTSSSQSLLLTQPVHAAGLTLASQIGAPLLQPVSALLSSSSSIQVPQDSRPSSPLQMPTSPWTAQGVPGSSVL
jgi:hypothetical protein